MKENALDVADTVKLGIALGADAVMYNRVNINGIMRPYVHELVPTADLIKRSLFQLQSTIRKYRIPAVCSVPIPACVVDVNDYPDIRFGWCPRGGENAYYTIGCDGLLRPCNHSSVVLGDL